MHVEHRLISAVAGVRERAGCECVCSLLTLKLRLTQSQTNILDVPIPIPKPLTSDYSIYVFLPFFTKHVLCLDLLDLKYVCVMFSFGCAKKYEEKKTSSKFQW